MMKDSVALLKAGIRELGLSCSEKQVGAFLTYLEELKKWNKAYNLTALKIDRDIIIKHFLDSLLFAKALPPEVSTLADIGSGAGFPGIPIKIMFPSLSVFLIEPTQKKAVFLRHICSKLQLQDVEIIDKRIEEVKGLQVDVAVTRALYSVKEFIEKTKDIINKNGILILSKGPGLEKELLGLDQGNISISDFKLPFENIIRHMVVVGGSYSGA
jgi:16S rRNA (guanine527-N7)-methyltransferase